jgi:hypothetical protein
MARAVGGAYGNFKGRLGQVSARIINGKTILYSRPVSFKENTKQSHLDAKKKFAVASAFASNVIKLPVLYNIWKLNKEPGSSEFNTVFKFNFDLSSVEGPTLQNIITPGGFDSPVISAAVTPEKLIVTLSALNNFIIASKAEENLSVNALVGLTNPLSENDPSFVIIPAAKELIEFNFGEVCNLEIKLNVEEAYQVEHYSRKIIYLSVATKSAYNEIVRYSKSHSLISV